MSHETQAKLAGGLSGQEGPQHAQRSHADADWAARSAVSAGQERHKWGQYDEAILIYDAGLRVLGASRSPLWAELHTELGKAKLAAGENAKHPDAKRIYWQGAARDFAVAQSVMTQTTAPEAWEAIEKKRVLAERGLSGAYIAQIHIESGGEVRDGDKARHLHDDHRGGYGWTTLANARATLHTQQEKAHEAEHIQMEKMLAHDPSAVNSMRISADGRHKNEETYQELNWAARQLETMLCDPTLESEIARQGPDQAKHALAVLAAYQDLAHTDLAITSVKWARHLLAQKGSRLYQAFANADPQLENTIATTILEPALPSVLTSRYPGGYGKSEKHPMGMQSEWAFNSGISAAKLYGSWVNLPNVFQTAADDKSDAATRGAGSFSRMSGLNKKLWLYPSLLGIPTGATNLYNGELWNGLRYEVPSIVSTLTYINGFASQDLESLSGVRRSFTEAVTRTGIRSLAGLATKWEPIIGLGVDPIAFYEHAYVRESSIQNKVAAAGDVVGFVACLGGFIANMIENPKTAGMAMVKKWALKMTIPSGVTVFAQLGGDLAREIAGRIYVLAHELDPDDPVHGAKIFFGLARNSITPGMETATLNLAVLWDLVQEMMLDRRYPSKFKAWDFGDKPPEELPQASLGRDSD